MRVEGSVAVPAAPERVWAALTDWPDHSAWIPLTRVRTVTERPDGVGAGFVGRTGIGRLAFDDPMVVTGWDPPRRAVVRKTGRVVRGAAEFRVEPAPGGARVTLVEDVTLPLDPLSRRAAPLAALGVRLVLRRFARHVARG